MDTLFHKSAPSVVHELREYVSMVQVRAPDAPVVVVFTKADRVSGLTSLETTEPTEPVVKWVTEVVKALHAEFTQVVLDNETALIVSSKDGWEASQVRVREYWTQLALKSGAGDMLPESYGQLRDALSMAGAAWKEQTGADAAKSLVMRWGTQVPIATVAAVWDMARERCGLSNGADIHQPLLLLHHMGCVVYGGALCAPDRDMHVSLRAEDAQLGADSHPDLSQLVVLDPQWLADMLSRVVTQYAKCCDDTCTHMTRGHVPRTDFGPAWHGYPDELRGRFLEVLFALGLAFPGIAEDGSSADYITVPSLLPLTPARVGEDVAKLVANRTSTQKQVG